MKTRVLLIVVGLAVFFQSVQAADWPQWRGPQRNGISPETGLLKEWPKNGPKLLSRIDDIDYGYSTPAFVGNVARSSCWLRGMSVVCKISKLKV